MEKTKKRRGRPRVASANRKRNMVTMRMRDALKADLEKEAAANQRSLSEEIEHQLEETRLLRRLQAIYKQLTELLLGLAVGEEKPGVIKDWDKDEKKEFLGRIRDLYLSMERKELPKGVLKPGESAEEYFFQKDYRELEKQQKDKEQKDKEQKDKDEDQS